MRETSTIEPRRGMPPSADHLRAVFDAAPLYTVGVEEEVMLLDPETLELSPCASEVLGRVDGDPRFKLELPASQVEIVLPPLPDPAAVEAALREARQRLVVACDGLALPAAAAVHPFSPGVGALNQTPRYAEIVREYGSIAARQLVCALQVHVSVGHGARALAVYNSLRSYLPSLAALASNGPIYQGCDTGLASVRPKLAELLPRQGVPPVIESWEMYAEMLRWGARAGTFPAARAWWWELRMHPRFGTLELRVPDAQTTVEEAAAVVAVAHALIVWLGARYDAGEALPTAAGWRIEENRWSACRHGVLGTMADLVTGQRRPTGMLLEDLLQSLWETGKRLGAEGHLTRARAMVECNGAVAQRRVASDCGTQALAQWLADCYSAPAAG